MDYTNYFKCGDHRKIYFYKLQRHHIYNFTKQKMLNLIWYLTPNVLFSNHRNLSCIPKQFWGSKMLLNHLIMRKPMDKINFFNLKLSSNVSYPEQKCLILKSSSKINKVSIQFILDLEKIQISNRSLEFITMCLQL